MNPKRLTLNFASGGRGGSVVGASDLGPEGREFEPWPSNVVFLSRTFNSHSASLHPGV